MPFCPVCKSEYREGFTRCFECDCDLVDSLPPEQKKVPPKAKKSQDFVNDEPVLLISGTSTIECGAIEGGLKAAGIPYLKQERETGGYMKVYMGYSVFGSDYYVPSKLLAQAKEALDATYAPDVWDSSTDEPTQEEDALSCEDKQNPDETEEETSGGRHSLSRRAVAIIIIVFLLLGLCAPLIIWLISLLSSF